MSDLLQKEIEKLGRAMLRGAEASMKKAVVRLGSAAASHTEEGGKHLRKDNTFRGGVGHFVEAMVYAECAKMLVNPVASSPDQPDIVQRIEDLLKRVECLVAK